MSYVLLEDMQFYAYHGCFKEEKVVGNKFLVNLKIKTNVEKAAESDNINDALNYQTVYDIVAQVMEIKSNLLEKVANEIIKKLRNEFDFIENIEIKLSKLNPPLGGQLKAASVILEG
jgi:dihydroneopterin aldolase